jgi:hypothetical protein
VAAHSGESCAWCRARRSKCACVRAGSLDLLLVTSALQSVWEGREAMERDFGKISVVSRDGLTSLKSLRGRPESAPLDQLAIHNS